MCPMFTGMEWIDLNMVGTDSASLPTMVHLILSSSKGNQGHRYFPYAGYLGLTPIRVEGIVRTKLDADQKPLQAKSITISIRCYESRIGRAGTSATNLLVDYTQVLWQKSPTTQYEPITNLEFPFRIVVPPRVAGFSTAVFVDYRCMWRVEAVLTHVPITAVGSRQIKHFELPLVRYDVPPPLPPLLPSIPYAPYSSSSSNSSGSSMPFFLHETSKPRAPRIRYTVHAPRTPIGPHDQVAIPIHIQCVDANLSVRSASIIVERRIILRDGSTASSSSAPIPIPIAGSSSGSSSQPNSGSRSFPTSASPSADASAASASADDYQKKRPNTAPFPSQHASTSSSFFGLGSSSSKNTSSSSSRPASSSSKSRPSSSGKEAQKEKSSGFAPFGFLTSSISNSSSSPNNYSSNHNNSTAIPNDSQLSFGSGGSGATITQSAVSLLSSESSRPLLGPSTSYTSSQPPTPASAPPSLSTPKALVHNIAFAESTGAFARVPMPTPSSTSDPPMPQNSNSNTYLAKTLTLSWPAAKGQGRWAVGSTIAMSELASVRFFLRTKVVVTYSTGNGDDGYSGSSVTESLELKEEEVLVVGAGEAERRAAVEALGGMFGSSRGASASREREEAGEGSSGDFDSAARRGKSKSPRRVDGRGRDRDGERERERDWENAVAVMPSPSSMQNLLSATPGAGGASITSSSGSSGRTVRPSKSSSAIRRPHTSAGYADLRQTASGGSVPMSTTYNTSGSGTESGTASGSASGQISASSSSSSSDAHGYARHGMPPSAYPGAISAGSSSSRRRADSGARENTSADPSSSSRHPKGEKREKREKERRPDTSSGLITSGKGANGFWSTVHSNPQLSSTSTSAPSFISPGGGRSGGSRSSGGGRPSTSAGVSSHSSGDKEKPKGGILGSLVLGAFSGSGSTITPVVSSNSAGEDYGTRSTGSTASDSSVTTTSSSGRSADYSNTNSTGSAASGRSHRHQHQQRPPTAGSSTNATAPTGGRASGAEREWEEELARIEARSRRSSDMLGFNAGMKSRGASRPPTASALPVPPVPVDLGLSMVHAGHAVDM
ncbi:hypothetical protein D9619_006007 [Psilocybe cf. subviscida]|uniref:Uncharacterized protein n=1 Tax=Psilocybe cf. subviscida TaxID=2480587 RepID=A0A8H5BVX6_9AGAR|nr:hypothetical protein D9619_006007 [Psilocybe cf. subviscida]